MVRVSKRESGIATPDVFQLVTNRSPNVLQMAS
jgi:hypothetical protein